MESRRRRTHQICAPAPSCQPEGHSGVRRRLPNLSEMHQAQGDLAGARPLKERTLAIREKVLGPEHPDTAQSLNDLAGLWPETPMDQGLYPPYRRCARRPRPCCRSRRVARALQYQIQSAPAKVTIPTGQDGSRCRSVPSSHHCSRRWSRQPDCGSI